MYPKGIGYSIPREGVFYPEGSAATRALRCAWHATTSALSTLGRHNPNPNPIPNPNPKLGRYVLEQRHSLPHAISLLPSFLSDEVFASQVAHP